MQGSLLAVLVLSVLLAALARRFDVSAAMAGRIRTDGAMVAASRLVDEIRARAARETPASPRSPR